RLLAVPVFVALHLGGRPGWALALFLAAALTDSLDGFLAGLLAQQTKLGAFLDPLADKLLMGAALIMLFFEDEAPLWMVLLVAFRDGAMALGALVVRRKGLEVPAAPSRVGKYAMFALTCYIVLGLLDETFTHSPLLHAWLLVAGYFTGLCVVISTTQYFLRWGHLWVAPARRAPCPGWRWRWCWPRGRRTGRCRGCGCTWRRPRSSSRTGSGPSLVRRWCSGCGRGATGSGGRRRRRYALQAPRSSRFGLRWGLRRSRPSSGGWAPGCRSAGWTWRACAAGRRGGWRWAWKGRSPRSSRRGFESSGRWRSAGGGRDGQRGRNGAGCGCSPAWSCPGQATPRTAASCRRGPGSGCGWPGTAARTRSAGCRGGSGGGGGRPPSGGAGW